MFVDATGLSQAGLPHADICIAGAGAAGEVVGYTVGTNKSINDRRTVFELDRFAHVSQTDKKAAPRTSEQARNLR